MAAARYLVLLLLLPAFGLAVPTAPALEAALPCEEAPLRETAMLATAGPADLVFGPCPGIRPGAQVSSPGGTCTMSWILQSGSTYYATIAGHCGDVGHKIKLASTGATIGEMVYSVSQPIGEDFGVFRIYSTYNGQVNAAMCAWGGATGVWTGVGGSHVVRHFGYGLGVGSVPPARARSGVLGVTDASAFAFEGFVMPGDSGSPARLASGEALGVITDLLPVRDPGPYLLPTNPLLNTGTVLGTRLDHGLPRASAATGLTFTLVTAPVDNEPVPMP